MSFSHGLQLNCFILWEMQLSFVYVLIVTQTFDNACHRKGKENSNFSKLKILFIRFLQVYIVYWAHSSSQSLPYIFTSPFAPVWFSFDSYTSFFTANERTDWRKRSTWNGRKDFPGTHLMENWVLDYTKKLFFLIARNQKNSVNRDLMKWTEYFQKKKYDWLVIIGKCPWSLA